MNKKILIIDDNEQDRKIMERFLKKAGYEDIITAETGEEGVGKAQSDSPDLAVIDTILPGINGFEVCQQIRERCGLEKPKIIVMTGSVDAIDAVKAKKAGADDYCVKTSDCAPLLEAANNIFMV
ncbi:MAG: response regulator [Candidatus Omnitrophota bacterium]